MTLFPLLEHFWSVLPPSLVTPKAMEKLQAAAKFFPPVPRIGIESRLGQEDQVDLQQCLLRGTDDLLQIQTWLQTQESHDRLDWQEFSHFLNEWCTKGSFFNVHIPEIFLELDLLPGNIRTPLVFLAINTKIKPTDLEEIVERLIGHRHLGLAKCIAALPAGAGIHFLGIPFSRNKHAIRINVKGLKHSEVLPTLLYLGWDASAIQEDIWQAFQHTDRVRVCLDLDENLLPNLGLECFWDDQPYLDNRWRYFLDFAQKQGLCLPDKAEAVLSWDESYFPKKGAPWPAPFWLASLKRKEHEFSHLKTKVSHLKLSLGKERSLKAYLGYGHLWDQETSTLPEEVPCPAVNCTSAIERGLAFLLRMQKPSGAWVDFRLPAGQSDEWVTAYVAYYLSFFPTTAEGLENAAEFLKRRFSPAKGWGHNLRNVRDGDSSIWVSLFLNKIHQAPNLTFLERYKASEGGVFTYVDTDAEMQAMTGLPPDASFTGWKSEHPCVTAAYALAGDPKAKKYLIKKQHSEGYVPAYWWSTPAYSTALAVEAVDSTEIDFHARAAAWAELQLAPAAKNPFQLALLLRILHKSGKNLHLIREISAKLRALQQADGSFEGTAGLRIPKPKQQEISVSDPIYQDQNRIFTTATVLYALHLVSNDT